MKKIILIITLLTLVFNFAYTAYGNNDVKINDLFIDKINKEKAYGGVNIQKKSDTLFKAQLIFTLFDENDVLKDIKIKETNIPKGDFNYYTEPFNLNGYSEKLKLKAFLFQGDNSLIPLTDKTVDFENYNSEYLERYKNVHPRLFLNSFDRIKTDIKNTEKINKLFNIFVAKLDSYMKNLPKDYYVDKSEEELWQRDIGDKIAEFTFAYKITDDVSYKNYLDLLVKKVLSYPSYGRGKHENSDLAAAHIIRGLSIYYDWMYYDILPEVKNKIKEKINIYCNAIKTSWWKEAYLQNHLWICVSSSFTSASAIYDECESAKEYLNYGRDKYKKVFSYLGDGGNHEGFLYWNYGFNFMAEYIYLSEKFLNINYRNEPYIRNTYKFGIYSLFPFDNNDKNLYIMNFGDSGTAGGEKALNALAFTSRYFGDNNAYIFTDKIIDYYIARKKIPDMRIFLLFDYKDYKNINSEITLPLNYHFKDLGYVFIKSGWDKNSDTVALRCGSVMGKKVAEENHIYDRGASHCHSDCGGLLISSMGEWILSDDGYVKNSTAQHNTLLIDNKGQYGDGGIWTREARSAKPYIEKEEEKESYTYVVANVKDAYPANLNLTKYKRHYVYLKQGTMLVVDDIETKGKKNLSLRFFPKSQDVKERINNKFLFDGNNISYSINSFNVENVVTEAKKELVNSDKLGGKKEKLMISLNNNTDKWVQPTAISWNKKGEVNKDIKVEISNNIIKYIMQDKTVSVDIINNKININ